MSTVDERVVEMKFNNQQFEKGVSQTTGSLAKLRTALNLDFEGTITNLKSVGGAFQKLGEVTGITRAIGTVGSRFSGLGIMGVTALATITNQAVMTGEQLVKSLTIDPIKQGFNEYELEMKSIQTILANTSRYGTKLSDVTKSLNQLNHYADQTIYSFSDMTSNIGLFTNAGIRLEDATSMIKGFSNAAAASGTNAEGAARAAYQLSQALSAGTIRLMDWRSLQNVGMGNKNMQKDLIDFAQAMGTISKHGTSATKIQKDFNGSLEKGWLTADVMSKYLKTMAGDMDRTKLAALGLSKTQIDALLKEQKIAQDSATKVRTWTQLIGTLQEAVGSTWSDTFRILIGNFNEATKLFTAMSNSMGGMILASGKARNQMLSDWKALGGRKLLIDALTDAWKALAAIGKQLHNAFTDIFPQTSGAELMDLTKAFAKFTESLMPSKKTLELLFHTARGVFAVFDIGRMVLVEVVKMLFRLIGAFTGGNSHILEATATLGDWLWVLRNSIKYGTGLHNFFVGLGSVLVLPIKLFKTLIGYATSFFVGLTHADFSSFSTAWESVTKRLTGGGLTGVFTGIKNFIEKTAPSLTPMLEAWGKAFGDIGNELAKGIGNIDYSKVLDTINTGLFAGLLLTIRESPIFGTGKSGFIGKFKEMISGVTDVLKAFETNVKSKTLLTIAIALAILTASLIGLSLVDSNKLGAATAAMAGLFTMLGIFTKVMLGFLGAIDTKGMLKLPILAAALIIFAVAVGVLTLSVAKLAQLSWDQLVRGLFGLTIILGGIVGFVKLIGPSMQKKMFAAGLGLRVIALSIEALAQTVLDLGKMKWNDLIKGLTGVTVLLGALAGFTKLVEPKALIATGIAMVLIGSGIGHLVKAVAEMGKLPMGTTAGGLAAISAAMVILAVALKLMPGNLLMMGAGLYIVAQAVVVIGQAVAAMGGLSIEQVVIGLVGLGGALIILAGAMVLMQESMGGAIAMTVAAAAIAVLTPSLVALSGLDINAVVTGLIALGGSLIIMAGAMALMQESIAGAAAMVIAAAAIAVLTPAIIALGGMDIGAVLTSLGVLTGVLVLLTAAGAALTYTGAVVGLLGLGAAILLIGAGVGIAALGIGVLVGAFAGLLAIGDKLGSNLTAVATALLNLIPLFLQKVGEGIVAFAKAIGDGAPAIIEAIGKIFRAWIAEATKNIPYVVDKIATMIVKILDALDKSVPKMIRSGMHLLASILKGIADNMDSVAKQATRVINKFLDEVGNNAPKIADHGATMLVKFLNGIADAIDKHSADVNAAAVRIGKAIIDGMIDGVHQGFDMLVNEVKGIGQAAIDAAKLILGIQSPSKEFRKIGENVTAGFVQGITGTADQIKSAFDGMQQDLTNFIENAGNDIQTYTDKIVDIQGKITQDKTDVTRQKARVSDAKDAHTQGKDVAAAKRRVDSLTLSQKKQNWQVTQNQKALTKAKNAAKDYTDVQVAQHRLNKAENAKHPDSFAIWLAQKQLNKAMAAHKDTKKIVDAQHKLDASKDTRTQIGKDLAQAKKDRTAVNKKHKANRAVKDAQAQQTKLQNKQKADEKDLADAQATLAQHQAEQAAAQAALDALNAEIATNQDVLTGWADDLKVVDDELQKQQQNLESLTQAAKQYTDQVASQYSTLESYSAQDATTNQQITLQQFMDDMQTQIDKNIAFSDKLAELRKRGLNNTLYEKFVTEGISSMPFMDQALEGGQEAVNQLNMLSDKLEANAKTFGETATKELKGAGIAMAQGIVDGLQSQHDTLTKQMADLGDVIADELKRKLEIQSPSRVMAKLGGFAGEGLAQGLKDSAVVVAGAASGMGDSAINALRDTMSNISSAVVDNVDVNPTIRPVLDLTDIQKGAGSINGMLGVPSIGVNGAYNQAAYAANGYSANQDAYLTKDDSASKPVVFNQYNNSPKALSPAEIYRNTRNQISVAKGALTRR